MDTFNPSKRSRDEFEAGASQGYEDDNKKQHMDPTTELISNVCKDIRKIGENSNLANQIDDISYISNPIVAEFEKIDDLRYAILNTLYALVIEQPQKINPLSNLILICNSKNFVVAKYVIEFFHSKAQLLLDTVSKSSEEDDDQKNKSKKAEEAGAFNDLKSITKFLATLSPIIDNYTIVDIFKQLLNFSIELQNADEKRNGIAEEIYYNVLISLPYLFSNDKSDDMVNRVNELVELSSGFKIREASCELLLPFDSKLQNYELPYTPKKVIDLIYNSIIKLQGDDKDWKEIKSSLFLDCKEIITPIIEDCLKRNSISNDMVKHQLPQFSLPSIEAINSYKPVGSIDKLWKENSRLLFQVYNSTDFETVPKIDSYYGLFFKDLSFDILTNLSFNKNEASIQLSILDLFFNKDLFAPPGSSIDQLSLINQDNISGENNPPLSTWKIEDIAVESILTMIFQLPHTIHYEIYYYTVLISCCRESPESIAPVFGRAIRYFYNNLETLDYELKIRFLDWMTTQISNFEFSWKWDEWVEDSKKLKSLKFHPKKNFIKNLIAKEIRLSNKNRIKESFVTVNPETNEVVALDEFHKYLNISLFEDDSKFVCDYDNELYGGSDSIKEILAKITYERKEAQEKAQALKPSIAPQEDLIYNFANTELPLHEISTKVYEFITANWKPNDAFEQLCDEILEACKSFEDIDAERFLINLIFQSYAYVGSRSIYSVISVLSRDINKLRFLVGSEINYKPDEPKFTAEPLTEEQIAKRQNWIIESIFRIWVHQPQVVFLILEYLIEAEILKPEYLIMKVTDLDNNLIITNVSCMESINRILNTSSKTDNFRTLFLNLLNAIIGNMNKIVESLDIEASNKVEIIKDFGVEDSENTELMTKIDQSWLLYEYKGLLKTYLRNYVLHQHADYLDDIKEIFKKATNEPIKEEISNWIEELI